MSRPTLAALASQQQMIKQLQSTVASLAHTVATQDLQLTYLARLAGVTPQFTAIKKKADANNPGQPIPDPASEPATTSTEEAVSPETHDDVRNLGMTPGSTQDVAADTTDVALRPGESLPTSPFNELVDVTAPVAGTETQLPLEQTRIETDVRVGDPDNPETAFPWTISPNQSNGGTTAKRDDGRMVASIRLARLQIQAGLAQGDDLALGAQIQASGASNEEIRSTIATLESVAKVAGRGRQRPTNLVPRTATGQVQRTVPSLSGSEGLVTTAGAASVSDDTADADLFLD